MYEDVGGIDLLPVTGLGAVALFGISVPLGFVALALVLLGAIFLFGARMMTTDVRRRELER